MRAHLAFAPLVLAALATLAPGKVRAQDGPAAPAAADFQPTPPGADTSTTAQEKSEAGTPPSQDATAPTTDEKARAAEPEPAPGAAATEVADASPVPSGSQNGSRIPGQDAPSQDAPSQDEPSHNEPSQDDDNAEDAERPLAANAVFIEALGPGVWYSINYERQLGSDVGLRVGFGYVAFAPNGGGGTALVAVPIGLTYSGVRSGPHAFEIHGGGTVVAASSGTGLPGGNVSSDQVFPSIHAGLGYRRHPLAGKPGFFLRAGIDVVAVIADFRAVYPWPYVGLGAAF